VIKEFTDLLVWQNGHKLVLNVYKISFPRSETFALADQVRRAVVSVTSNIAEGFGRQTMKEKVHYYYQAHGSLTEVKNQLIIARDLKYLSYDDFTKIMEILGDTHRLLLGLISKTKSYLK
jgi:four helix bundle protein